MAACLCCLILHPAHDDGMATLREALDDAQRRWIETAYTLELLLGKPLALLQEAWLVEQRAIREEWARRLEDLPRD